MARSRTTPLATRAINPTASPRPRTRHRERKSIMLWMYQTSAKMLDGFEGPNANGRCLTRSERRTLNAADELGEHNGTSESVHVSDPVDTNDTVDANETVNANGSVDGNEPANASEPSNKSAGGNHDSMPQGTLEEETEHSAEAMEDVRENKAASESGHEPDGEDEEDKLAEDEDWGDEDRENSDKSVGFEFASEEGEDILAAIGMAEAGDEWPVTFPARTAVMKLARYPKRNEPFSYAQARHTIQLRTSLYCKASLWDILVVWRYIDDEHRHMWLPYAFDYPRGRPFKDICQRVWAAHYKFQNDGNTRALASIETDSPQPTPLTLTFPLPHNRHPNTAEGTTSSGSRRCGRHKWKPGPKLEWSYEGPSANLLDGICALLGRSCCVGLDEEQREELVTKLKVASERVKKHDPILSRMGAFCQWLLEMSSFIQ